MRDFVNKLGKKTRNNGELKSNSYDVAVHGLKPYKMSEKKFTLIFLTEITLKPHF